MAHNLHACDSGLSDFARIERLMHAMILEAAGRASR
jgi:hypothetical protein